MNRESRRHLARIRLGCKCKLPPRIYNDRAQQSASRAVSQVVNGCAAHAWRQLLICHLKTCSLFIEITIYKTVVVIDLNVRRNQPQCSNFALNVRTHQSHCDSCRSKGGRCQGTDGNSPYIFSAEKCTFIIKYSKVWKWCRTFNANFFDLNVRHLTWLRSFCVEHSGQLP